MDKHFIWVAVDSNGDEKLTSNPEGFQRFSPRIYNGVNCSEKRMREEQNKVLSFNDTQQDHDIWIEYHDPKTKEKYFHPHFNYLPKGTIKRLLGKELTWEDEPVKIEGY